jgi:hypothetical protein
MKRDFNLIRELMLYMNNYNCGCMLQKYTQQQIIHHMNLLKQAGYIKDGYFTEEGIRILHLIDNKVLFDEALEVLRIKGQFYSFDILLMFLQDMHKNKMKKPIYKEFKHKNFNDYKVLDLVRFFYDKDYEKSVMYYMNLNSCHILKNVCIKNEKICLAVGLNCIGFTWDESNVFTVRDLLFWLNSIDINTSIYDIFAIDIIFEWHKYFNFLKFDLLEDHIMNIVITRDKKFRPAMVNSISNFEKKYIAGNNIV